MIQGKKKDIESFCDWVDREVAKIEGELIEIDRKRRTEGWFYQPAVRVRVGLKGGFHQITLESTALLHNFDHNNPKHVMLVQPWLGSEVSVWTKLLPQGNKTFLKIKVGARLVSRPSERICLQIYEKYYQYLLTIREPILTHLAKTVEYTLIGKKSKEPT